MNEIDNKAYANSAPAFSGSGRDTGIPGFETPDLARRVDGMALEEIDRLPFGAVHLDRDGVVSFYSRREAELSGRGSRPTLGLAFFTEVAPCMNNPSVRGRIEAAIAAGTLDAEMTHIGDFADRQREVELRAQSAADGGVWLFLRRH